MVNHNHIIFVFLNIFLICSNASSYEDYAVRSKWSHSGRRLYIAAGLFIAGRLEKNDENDIDIALRVNGNELSLIEDVNLHIVDCEQHLAIYIGLLYDFQRSDYVFSKQGIYNIEIIESNLNQSLERIVVNVTDITQRLEEPFKLYSDPHALKIILSHEVNDKGRYLLEKLISDYPEAPWVSFSKYCLGVALFNERLLKPVGPEWSLEQKTSSLTSLAEYFKPVAESDLGLHSLIAKYHLAYCMALNGEYSQSKVILSKVIKCNYKTYTRKSEKLLSEMHILQNP